MNNPKKCSSVKDIETSPEGLTNKIMQALKINEGDGLEFSVTRGGYVLLRKEQSAQPELNRGAQQ
jgi:hypothetical protein